MTRIRIATFIAVVATGLFLFGCGQKADTRWNAAPEPSVTDSSAAPGGAGGGETMSSLVVARASETGIPGVLKNTGTDEVALTFDDGPDPKYTPALLALLRKHGVKATFCLVGVQVQAHPELVQAIVADGHTLCNHTWRHDIRLGTRGESAIRADLQRTHDAILAAAPGAVVKYFRHPGGMWTPTAVSVAAAMGMASIGWDVDTNDWNVARWPAGNPMKQQVLSVLRNQVKPGSIVLAHDAGGDRTGTLGAFEVALPELLAKFKLAALP